ncbi:MAG TPA: YciI family protein [candidate division Zixibacteria bacterium]|nr:YciI family protein [candidate division Zixibacteria bacterium]
MSEHYLLMYYPPRKDFINNQTKEESDAIGRHFLYLKGLHEKKIVLMAGRVEDARFGMALLAVESEKEALDIMKNDPAVKAVVFRAELLPFIVAIPLS